MILVAIAACIGVIVLLVIMAVRPDR